MRYSTSGMVLAAVCLGEAVAGPAHAHLHQRVHQKKNVDWAALDWNNMGIDWSKAYEEGQATKTSAAAVAATTAPAVATVAAVKATTTSAAAVAASTTKASAASTIKGDIASLWNDLVGIANDFTSFGTATTATSGSVDSYIGNIGSPQGSNMIKVSSREGYAFTNEFINTSGEDITVVIWNKAYSTTGDVKDAEANLGSCVAPVTPILSIPLAKGASQIVAFQENSQIGFCQATSAKAASAAFATTWGEVNFLTTGTGYDMSAIMNANGNDYNMTMSSTECPCISDMTQNYWLTPTQPIGNSDGSCYIGTSTATLTTLMGGTVA